MHFSAEDAPVAILFDASQRDGPCFGIKDSGFLAAPAARLGRFERFFDLLLKIDFSVFETDRGKWIRIYGRDGQLLTISGYGNPDRLDLSVPKPIDPWTLPADFASTGLTVSSLNPVLYTVSWYRLR